MKAYGSRTERGTKGYVLALVRFALTSLSFDSTDQKGWSYRGSRNHTQRLPLEEEPARKLRKPCRPSLPFFLSSSPAGKKKVSMVFVSLRASFGSFIKSNRFVPNLLNDMHSTPSLSLFLAAFAYATSLV